MPSNQRKSQKRRKNTTESNHSTKEKHKSKSNLKLKKNLTSNPNFGCKISKRSCWAKLEKEIAELGKMRKRESRGRHFQLGRKVGGGRSSMRGILVISLQHTKLDGFSVNH